MFMFENGAEIWSHFALIKESFCKQVCPPQTTYHHCVAKFLFSSNVTKVSFIDINMLCK